MTFMVSSNPNHSTILPDGCESTVAFMLLGELFINWNSKGRYEEASLYILKTRYQFVKWYSM